jgi:hypothetical protein
MLNVFLKIVFCCRLLDLGELLGPLSNGTTLLKARTDQVVLIGEQGLWSRSLLLQSPSGDTACATIIVSIF